MQEFGDFFCIFLFFRLERLFRVIWDNYIPLS